MQLQLHGQQRAAARNFGRARAAPRVAAPLLSAAQRARNHQSQRCTRCVVAAVGDRLDRVSLSMDYGDLFDGSAECPLGAVEGAPCCVFVGGTGRRRRRRATRGA